MSALTRNASLYEPLSEAKNAAWRKARLGLRLRSNRRVGWVKFGETIARQSAGRGGEFVRQCDWVHNVGLSTAS
jgi:hypothetical protein